MKPVGLWPRLAGAAITGAQYFPVVFGADEADELCKAERKSSEPRDANPGDTRRAGEVDQSRSSSESRSGTRKGAEALPGETGVACPT